jgi:hypothetical protein
MFHITTLSLGQWVLAMMRAAICNNECGRICSRHQITRPRLSPWFVSSARLLEKFIYLFPFQKAACIISTDEVLCLLPQVYSKKAAVRTINYSAAMWEALFNAKLFKLHNSAERSRAECPFAQIFQVHKRM